MFDSATESTERKWSPKLRRDLGELKWRRLFGLQSIGPQFSGCLLGGVYVPCVRRMPGGGIVSDSDLCCCVPSLFNVWRQLFESNYFAVFVYPITEIVHADAISVLPLSRSRSELPSGYSTVSGRHDVVTSWTAYDHTCLYPHGPRQQCTWKENGANVIFISPKPILIIYLFIDLFKVYSPVDSTGSPQGFSLQFKAYTQVKKQTQISKSSHRPIELQTKHTLKHKPGTALAYNST